jgi:hypothetical protein
MVRGCLLDRSGESLKFVLALRLLRGTPDLHDQTRLRASWGDGK